MMPIAAAAGLLADLAVSAQTIADIKEILAATSRTSRRSRWTAPPRSPSGSPTGVASSATTPASPSATWCEAINDLVVGLDGYRESVEWAWQHIDETDGGVTGSMTNITVRIDENRFNEAAPCVDQPDLETNPSCEVPTGDN